MDLKLYRDVPFTKDYNVVVNDWTIGTGKTKTALETLLSTKHYTTFSNIDYYLTFPTGQIMLPKSSFDSNDYLNAEYNQINYISFTLYESGTQHLVPPTQVTYYNGRGKGEYLPFNIYAFVDKMTLGNECYIVDFTIDYIHTYMSQIKHIKGHVIRWSEQSYYIDSNGSIKYPKLACDYNYKSLDGNIYKYYDPTTKTFKNDFSSYKFNAIVQIQLYDLNAQGEQNNREIILTKVWASDQNGVINDDLDGTIVDLNFLFLHQGDSNYKILNKFYQIMHIYFINDKIINTTISITSTTSWLNALGTNQSLNIDKINTQTINTTYFFKNEQYTSTLANLQNIKSFGTMAHQIEFQFDNNNLVNKIDLISIFDGFSFNIYMKYKDITVNITSDFEIFYPYTVDDASAREIDKFNRQYNDRQLDLKEGKTTIGLIGGAIGSVVSIGAGVVAGSILGAVAGTGGLIGTIINGLFASEDIKNQREKNNAQLYATNSMSVISADNFLNVYYGLVFNFLNNSTFADGQTTYDSIINFTDVNNEIADMGFKTDFVIDFIYLMNNTEAFNNPLYIKLSDTHIDGYFDNDTNQILTAIFNKGFKYYNIKNYNDINRIV